jgi:hypothetical protein
MDLQDTINKIDQLQKTEQQLYDALSQNAERVSLGKKDVFTPEDIQNITTQINSLSAARVNLYNTLAELYKSQVHLSKEVKISLDQQTETLQLLEKQLNKSKKEMASLQDQKLNQLKMIEITTYYSKQYDAQKRLMQIIAIVGVCLLLCTFIKINLLTYTIAVAGGILIALRILNMSMRTNYDYDEIKWFSLPNTSDSSSNSGSDSTAIGITGPSIGTLCAGSSCCSAGTIWDSTSGCVPQS